MKKNILKLFLCFALIFGLILGICACNSSNNSDTGSGEADTSTQSDTSTDTNSDAPLEVSFYIYGKLLKTESVRKGEYVSEPSVSKDGYTLSEWKNGNKAWDFSTAVTENLSLHASWIANKVTVKFNGNGGFGQMQSQETETMGEITLTGCAFGRPGYTFSGWSTSSDGYVYFLDGEVFTAGTDAEYELFAIWSPNKNSLRLDFNNTIDTDQIEVLIKTGESYTLELQPTRAYHKFLGWSKTRDGVVDFEPNDVYTMGSNASYTLYAVWELDAPQSVDIDVIKNGSSPYTIVYTRGNATEQAFAKALSAYIADTYGVTIPYHDSSNSELECEIVIGNAREKSFIVASTIAKYNDFSIGVLENDLIIYAPNEYLYDYMLEIARLEVFTGGDSLSFKANESFVYSRSEYKNMNYAQYLKQKNGDFDYNKLLGVFKEQIYTADDGTVLPYRIYVPSNYNSDSGNPVVTILHGAGERGTDNSSQLKNMVAALFNQPNSPYLNSIIIAPQCPRYNSDGSEARWVDWNWENGNYSVSEIPESNELKAVYELVSGLRDEMVTDISRYYIMGLSMGGFGTWDMIMRHGDIFAAAIPICGGGDPTQAEVLVDIHIYTVHGTADPTVPHSGTKAMYDAIIAEDGKRIVFDSLQGYNHFVWDYVGKSTEITTWLFAKRK